MNIRNLKLDDLVKLESEALFPVDFLLGKKFATQGSVEEDGLVGSFFVSETVELSVIFGETAIEDRIRAMRLIEEFLQKTLSMKDVREVHVFIKDDDFADVLKNHFGFEDVVGRALVRRI